MLLKDWLTDRKSFVDINGEHSSLHDDNHGTVQGSVLGPVLFSIFIRPLYDLEIITTYADDNYLGSENYNLNLAKLEIKRKINITTKWLCGSGLKINLHIQ